jgi:predicted nuclease of restriction endonuclease-like RecB superfamily
MVKYKCDNCGKPVKSWFKLCADCNKKEKQRPSCEICGIGVPENHTLCKTHWLEREQEKKKLKQIDYVKIKKEVDFREKFEGKYYFNGQKVKSKSELLMLYFFEANNITAQYETPIYLGEKEYRPDFIICNGESQVIVEHFGMDEENYNKRQEAKIKEYEKLCGDNDGWYFIWTDENDMFNLKDKLGKKLNTTPLKKIMWK